MKSRKTIFTTLAAFMAVACLVACHDDDDTTETDYVDGSVSFDFPSYVLQGYTQEVTASGAYLEDDDDTPVYYRWNASWNDVGYDTTDVYSAVIPDDTLGTFTLACYAFALDYTSINKSQSVTIVNDGLDGSLTETGIADSDSCFTDTRDGTTYYTTTIDTLSWMRNNLAWDGSGTPYEDAEAMRKISGHYYNWEEAVGACPEGWRLPTDAEFAAMATAVTGTAHEAGQIFAGAAGALMADAYFNGTRLWEYWPDVKVTNASKLSMLPFGYAIDGGGTKFEGAYSFAAFWTADEVDADRGLYRYISSSYTDVYCNAGDKASFRANVRCVRTAD